MYQPSFKEFSKFAKTANVIPVYKEINADLDTPVSSYLKMKKDNYSFLFESVEGQEKVARYSFLGSRPSLIFKSKGRNIEIIRHGALKRYVCKGSVLNEIKKIMRDFKSLHLKGLPRFYGGLVGFIGYDFVRFFENIPDKNPDKLDIPDSLLMLTDSILIFDHVNHTIKIVANVMLHGEKLNSAALKKHYDKAIKSIELAQEDLERPFAEKREKLTKKGVKINSNYTKSGYEQMVSKAKKYIRRGDIIQVVPSQRFEVKSKRDPFEIYRTLRSLNPSPYMYLLKLKDMALVGTSPEMLVRCEDGLIQTRPIAGTRPRGKNETEDRLFEKELLADKKEKAEHLMLVDLGRNDLGRVSKTGTVTVSEFMKVERYSHVMHLVSEVRGLLDKKRYDIYDVLKAAFPAGTVTGSPKIRAMEIIDELENTRRGPYAGCVGYFSFSHNMDTCITIRTILVRKGSCYIQAGAGIVADSVPEKEYYESVNKAKALIEAIIN